MNRVFVGFDSEQALASAVFVHSLIRRASVPVSVHFLVLSQMKAFFDRPRDPYQSTEFAFSRFLVPHLCGYAGRALFCDGDMIMRADISELLEQFDERYAVQVVQRHHHEMTPDGLKFLGRPQTAYPRKNWSSVMLFNNAKCRRLTPEYVAAAPGLELHQFVWLDERDIGAIKGPWNHLVGVDQPNPAAKLVHFTLGMPYFTALRACEYAEDWRAECDSMLAGAEG